MKKTKKTNQNTWITRNFIWCLFYLFLLFQISIIHSPIIRQIYRFNKNMANWITFGEGSVEDSLLCGKEVKSSGDWTASLMKISKEDLQRQAAIAQILEEHGLNDLTESELDREVRAINKFHEALLACNLTMAVEDCSQIETAHEISPLLYFEILVNDGNTTLSIMEDDKNFYCIFYETS